MRAKQRADVLSVAIDLEHKVEQLESDLLAEVNPQKRLMLREEIHEFSEMIEKLENALK